MNNQQVYCAVKNCKRFAHIGYSWCAEHVAEVESEFSTPSRPIPMRLNCPECGKLHIDKGEFATKVHHTHACQHCGMVWRPAIVATVGVQFLPGFKNEQESS